MVLMTKVYSPKILFSCYYTKQETFENLKTFHFCQVKSLEKQHHGRITSGTTDLSLIPASGTN